MFICNSDEYTKNCYCFASAESGCKMLRHSVHWTMKKMFSLAHPTPRQRTVKHRILKLLSEIPLLVIIHSFHRLISAQQNSRQQYELKVRFSLRSPCLLSWVLCSTGNRREGLRPRTWLKGLLEAITVLVMENSAGIQSRMNTRLTRNNYDEWSVVRRALLSPL